MAEPEFQQEEDQNNYTYVPWSSWDEWSFVRENLFSSSPDSVASAMRRISAWQARGRLPVAIEETARFVRAQQIDPFFREDLADETMYSKEILVDVYGMAITRFVNGFVEKSRKKTGFTTYQSAEAIGIPRMLVDIRHEISHKEFPSLPLVRHASMKALDWIQSYYWEPQKNAIPNFKGEIKDKIHELAYCIKVDKVPQSLQPKGRRFKKHIIKLSKSLLRLYSLFPLDVVRVLLDSLPKSDLSDGLDAECSGSSQVNSSTIDLKQLIGTIDDWKVIITKLSSYESELLLTILNAVFKMIETMEAMKSDIGSNHLPSSQYQAEIHRIKNLSSLVPWLIHSLKEIQNSDRVGSMTETQDSFTRIDAISKQTISDLLRKCLLILPPGDDHYFDSVLLLTQMIGKNSLADKLKKLTQIRSINLDSTVENAIDADLKCSFLELDEALNQAAKELESLKQRRGQYKTTSTALSNNNSANKSLWTVTKLWNPCPIGMLPREYSSIGILPVLDSDNYFQNDQEFIEKPEHRIKIQHTGKREASQGVDLLGLTNVKKMRVVTSQGVACLDRQLLRTYQHTDVSDGHDDLQLHQNSCEFTESMDCLQSAQHTSKRDVSCDVEFLSSIPAKKMRETMGKDTNLDDQADSLLQPVESNSLGDSQLQPVEGQLLIGGFWKKVGKEELLAIESGIRILV